ILSDAIHLEDVGAQKPLLSADNMRLDVELWPLFSKKLVVKNVLVKAAVINLSEYIKGDIAHKKQSSTATVVNHQTTESISKLNQKSPWHFTLDKLEIVDSTVVLQTSAHDWINLRKTNIAIHRQNDERVVLTLNGNLNRNQQSFDYDLQGRVNLQQYPQRISLAIDKFNYRLASVGNDGDNWHGNLTAMVNYQASPFSIVTNDLLLTVNGNQLDGKISFSKTGKIPDIEAVFSAKQFDLTPFITKKDKKKEKLTVANTTHEPVVSMTTQGNELAFLNKFNGAVKLHIDTVLAQHLKAQNFDFDLMNKSGNAIINKAKLNIANGEIAVTGSADANTVKTNIKLNVQLNNLMLSDFFNQLQMPYDLTGVMYGQANLSLNTIKPAAIMSAIHGGVNLDIDNARLNNINIDQVIQRAVSQVTKNIAIDEQQKQYTQFHHLSAKGELNEGKLMLSSLLANSDTLDINGHGEVNLLQRHLDVGLNVKVFSGWKGKNDIITQLQKLTIPFRIYGEFAQLHYGLDIDKLIKEQLKKHLQENVDKLIERYLPHEKQNKDTSSEEKKSASRTERLKGLLDRLKNK
ncbi:MAG: AsmA family protein, partial [Candidatus Schmidhempelia sp.]|nr:AsmA family protein [Candidatus Schmidhempelia sp.]